MMILFALTTLKRWVENVILLFLIQTRERLDLISEFLDDTLI